MMPFNPDFLEHEFTYLSFSAAMRSGMINRCCKLRIRDAVSESGGNAYAFTRCHVLPLPTMRQLSIPVVSGLLMAPSLSSNRVSVVCPAVVSSSRIAYVTAHEDGVEERLLPDPGYSCPRTDNAAM